MRSQVVAQRELIDRWTVEEDPNTPLRGGVCFSPTYTGDAYRNLTSSGKYTVEIIDLNEARVLYTSTDEDGKRIEWIGEPTDLAVVEAVGDSLRCPHYSSEKSK